MSIRNYVIGAVAALCLGAFATVSNIDTPKNEIKKPVLEQRAEDFEFAGHSSVIFQELVQIGEHEYSGRINGKQYLYRFDIENNRVELYLKVRKK